MTGQGISIEQAMSIANNTLPTLVKGKFVETVKLQQYTLVEDFAYRGNGDGAGLPTGVSVSGTDFQKRARLRSNVGSTAATQLYATREPKKGPANEIWKIPQVIADNRGIVFDRREQALNSGNSVQIVSFLKSERSAAWEDIANWLEAQLLGCPTSASDNQNWRGLKYYGRLSMTSGGAFVEDQVGGFNGVYNRYAENDTVFSTINNIDAADIRNERARGWVATRKPGMSLGLCETIRRGAEASNFRPLMMLKGEQQRESDCVVYMRPSDHEEYKTLVNQGPDDRRGDIFPYTETTIAGMRIKRLWQAERDPLIPIYGCRLPSFDVLQLPGFWLNECPAEKIDHNIAYVAIDVTGNLFCDNPRSGMFHIHGEF